MPKILFYLASILDNFDLTKEIDTLKIDLAKMFKYTNITIQETKNNLKAMQETSITFINENEEWEEHIVLIPKIEFFYGKKLVEIVMFSKIAKLYDRISEESFDVKRANEIWTTLYELAKDGKLGVLE